MARVNWCLLERSTLEHLLVLSLTYATIPGILYRPNELKYIHDQGKRRRYDRDEIRINLIIWAIIFFTTFQGWTNLLNDSP